LHTLTACLVPSAIQTNSPGKRLLPCSVNKFKSEWYLQDQMDPTQQDVRIARHIWLWGYSGLSCTHLTQDYVRTSCRTACALNAGQRTHYTQGYPGCTSPLQPRRPWETGSLLQFCAQPDDSHYRTHTLHSIRHVAPRPQAQPDKPFLDHGCRVRMHPDGSPTSAHERVWTKKCTIQACTDPIVDNVWAPAGTHPARTVPRAPWRSRSDPAVIGGASCRWIMVDWGECAFRVLALKTSSITKATFQLRSPFLQWSNHVIGVLWSGEST